MKTIILFFTLIMPAFTFALVDMKNANYTNTWVDMEVPGTGYDLKIIRTYNSRSLFNGMFGFGWCSDFETKIEPTAEGNIKLTECGAGQETIFSPKEVSKKDIDDTVNQIITKMKAESSVGRAADYYSKMSTQLYENIDIRASYAKKYGLAKPVADNVKYYANGSEVDHMIYDKKNAYYNRTMVDGGSQRFNIQGQLTHYYDKNSNYLKFEYGDGGTLKSIEDNNRRKLTFKYFPNKKVQTIVGPNNIMAIYKFSNMENLSMVDNAWGKKYTYEYDELHNLTKAIWPDNTFIAIKYNTKKDWVTSFTDRDKCNESYNYEFSTSDPENHYWATAKKVCEKKVVADNRYEFWYKQRPDGQHFLQRVLTDVSGVTTDITYHEVFSKPISIRKNAEKMGFEYFPTGLVKKKTAGNAVFNYEYDKEVKKVSKVTTQFLDEKLKPTVTKVAEFKYDKKGNLDYAENSDGQKIKMSYDPKGRIETITDHAKKIVKIQYDEKVGKPAMVSRPGLGSIKVTYKPNGEINNVESSDGPSVALQVASTFNNLLDVIAPATAELYQ